MPSCASGIAQILRAAFDAHGGVEQGTEGDSFFVVFGSAREAVAAAIEAQRALRAGAWPDGRAPSASGWASTRARPSSPVGACVGLDINRAARIAAAAHGEPDPRLRGDPRAGRRATCRRARSLPDLGAVKLKDLPRRRAA